MTKIALKKFGFIRIALAAGVGFPLFIATSLNAQNPDAPAPVTPVSAADLETAPTTERVFVTGSNLPTSETESALPVTTYSAEIIKKAGANTPAEGLRQLPSFVGNTVTENDSNGGDGTASVNLRALGPTNTLTLINSRRAFLNVGGANFTNINAIPLGAISRVEVLQDGASSVYGTDAVAGVVNFIFLNGPGEAPYEGAESFFLYGNTTDHDARVLNGYLRGGVVAMDGKVAIAAVGEYYDRNDLYSRDREIAVSADRRPLGGNNQGSPTFSGRAQFTTATNGSGPGVQSILLNSANNAPIGPASYRSFSAGLDAESFNFRLYTPSISGMEKASYYVAGRYKIFDDMVQMYGDILYSKTKQDNGLAPAPFALSNFQSNLSVFNPFFTNSNLDPDGLGPLTELNDNQLKQLRYRLVQELGNRRSFFDYDYYRYTVGFNGDFNMKDNQFVSTWGYDAAFIYHRSDQLRIDSGDAQASIIVNALNPATSTVFDALGNPVLFNPFIGQNAPTSGTVATYSNSSNGGAGAGGVATGNGAYDNQAVVDAASYVGHSYFHERDYLYDIKVFGNLFPGLYQGGIGATVGYEHRNLATHTIPDPVQVAGDQLGFNAASLTKYVQEVDSFFGELQVPLIVPTQNIPWLRSAEIGFAYRYESFDTYDQFGPGVSSFDNGGDPRISVRIKPIDDLVLRASWSKSFFSPLPFQLFDPVQQNFPEVTDPGYFDVGLGMDVQTSNGAPFQPPDGVAQSGNPLLQPEETDSYSVGFVYTPTFVKNLTGGTFTLIANLYQAYTTNLILGAADFAQLMLTLNARSGNTLFVDADGPGGGVFDIDGDGSLVNNGVGLGITRDPLTGDVTAIDSVTNNAGKRLVNGLDVTAIYQLPTQNWGQFTWTLGYNYFFTWKASTGPGNPLISYLGDFTSSIPLTPGALPYHKGFLRGEWEWRNWDFVATGNYISSFYDDPQSAILLPDTADPNDPFRRVTDYITLDMQLSYEFRKPITEAVAASYAKDAKDAKSASAPVGGADNGTIYQRMIWNTKLTVGVNNAFDRNPPTVLGAFNDNYDTSLYTIRNRYWYASITKRF